ncbi:RagB/SusD family nutrient uptake outer membrane protein [Sphingobacterium sp.]|uniref:RagB/SusD family nutrient uptake outer membrane protein n=1 Tax=Sphingobacterium sp. TaxID=341027 RepID=UPI0031D75FF3
MRKLYLLVGIFLFTSCAKDFLEVKSNQSDEIPYRVEDYQAMLDNTLVMNMGAINTLGMISGDEITVNMQTLQNFKPYSERNAYLWKKDDFFEGEQSKDWNYCFRRIMYSNIVLNGLDNLNDKVGQADYNNTKGAALFFRAFNYYNLSQLFCPVYDVSKSGESLGLPLRKDDDVTVKYPRSSLKDTYEFILKDLKEAADLLPKEQMTKFRPTSLAVHALLARIYLQMADYDNALIESDFVLKERPSILDFNTLGTDGTISLVNGNPEIIFEFHYQIPSIAPIGVYYLSKEQYELFQDNDLRKSVYIAKFGNYNSYYGFYSPIGYTFGGLSTDELRLIYAECLARNNKINDALTVLNTLRMNRFKNGTSYALTSQNKQQILSYILKERRLELLLRGTRWEDIRRLNRDNEFPVAIIKESFDGNIIIEPNDGRFVFPLPDNAIDLGGYQQNLR